LNPGPHGPESHDIPSRSVDSCLLQFDSFDFAALLVQIGVNLQPDYYMKYYMDTQSKRVQLLDSHRHADC